MHVFSHNNIMLMLHGGLAQGLWRAEVSGRLAFKARACSLILIVTATTEPSDGDDISFASAFDAAYAQKLLHLCVFAIDFGWWLAPTICFSFADTLALPHLPRRLHDTRSPSFSLCICCAPEVATPRTQILFRRL